MKPRKPITSMFQRNGIRGPLCPPPPEAERNARGLELRKLEKHGGGEDQGMALERARASKWGHLLAENRAYWSSVWWLFLVKKEPV